jgi:hypothetical protein
MNIIFFFFLAFEPIRVSVQGEVIRDLDTSTSQKRRKTEHGDSDDEEQHSQSNMNGRGTMNIYKQRLQKRAKLNADSSLPPVLI